MFNTAFNHLIPADKAAVDIYPAVHRAEIDSINEWVYDTVSSESGLASRLRLPYIHKFYRWRLQGRIFNQTTSLRGSRCAAFPIPRST